MQCFYIKKQLYSFSVAVLSPFQQLAALIIIKELLLTLGLWSINYCHAFYVAISLYT